MAQIIGRKVIGRKFMQEIGKTVEVTCLVLRCSCGEEVDLPNFTNTCDKCGADYNSAGQRLAPRSQWGEETGESVSDILSIDSTSTDVLCEGD